MMMMTMNAKINKLAAKFQQSMYSKKVCAIVTIIARIDADCHINLVIEEYSKPLLLLSKIGTS
eukprot:6788638-Ditylum_brightwellii.AAC.1